MKKDGYKFKCKICADYVWDGQTLTYSPAAVEEPAPVQTVDDGSEVSYS